MTWKLALEVAACILLGVSICLMLEFAALEFVDEIFEAVGLVEGKAPHGIATTHDPNDPRIAPAIEANVGVSTNPDQLHFVDSVGEPDEPGAGEDDVTVKGEDLPLDGGLLFYPPQLATSTDNVLKFEAIDSEIVFGGGLDPLMTYNVDEQHWTLSDRFLEDVADALVPVLKERGFLPIGNKYKEEYFMTIRENSGDE